MKNLTVVLLTFLLVFSLSSCNPSKKTMIKAVDNERNIAMDQAELMKLFSLMQGSFNSEKQAKEDSTYYNISLHMYPIWKERGNYLYVEQALNKMQDKPYRQRIYKLTELDNGNFSSEIFKMENDSIWIGKWKTPEAFDVLKESDLMIREGCAVILEKLNSGHYKGSTGDRSCKSKLRGSTYATSEVEIFNDKIISWDRGFDDKGNHVWGAELAGYVFDKIGN